MSGRRRAEPVVKEHGLWHYLGLGVGGGLLALVVALAMAVIVVPAVVGATPLTVLTSSMEPTLPPGTLVVIKPATVDEIKVGDVLTYQIRSGDPAVVSHRVVSRTVSTNGTTTFMTKGDNNDVADANPVTPSQIKGTVWYSIPWLGYLNSAISGESRAWLIPLIAGALFLYAGYMAASGIAGAIKRRRSRAAATTAGGDVE